jgi:hypothetical protein
VVALVRSILRICLSVLKLSVVRIRGIHSLFTQTRAYVTLTVPEPNSVPASSEPAPIFSCILYSIVFNAEIEISAVNAVPEPVPRPKIGSGYEKSGTGALRLRLDWDRTYGSGPAPVPEKLGP